MCRNAAHACVGESRVDACMRDLLKKTPTFSRARQPRIFKFWRAGQGPDPRLPDRPLTDKQKLVSAKTAKNLQSTFQK